MDLRFFGDKNMVMAAFRKSLLKVSGNAYINSRAWAESQKKRRKIGQRNSSKQNGDGCSAKSHAEHGKGGLGDCRTLCQLYTSGKDGLTAYIYPCGHGKEKGKDCEPIWGNRHIT